MATASTKPPITTTGIKGFLMWFQREQPALFNKIAPQLPKVAPKAFGSYFANQKKLREIYRSGIARRTAMSGFADYSSYTLPTLYVSAPAVSSDPITVNYTAQLAPPAYTASPATLTTDNPQDMATPTLPPITAAANSGTASTPIANAIAQTVGAAASVYLTNQQAAMQQSIVQAQLARAAAGLPPLNTSLNANGIPTVTTGGVLSSGSMILLGGAALLAIMMTGGSSKK